MPERLARHDDERRSLLRMPDRKVPNNLCASRATVEELSMMQDRYEGDERECHSGDRY